MKKTILIIVACIPGIMILAFLPLSGPLHSARANPGILYVAPHANCGAIILNCYATIQAAVDHAASFDEIRVAAGVYTDTHGRPRHDTVSTGVVTQTVYISKSLTIRGGYNPGFTDWDPDVYSTTLDAQGRGRVIYVTGNFTPTIEWLYITGGDAWGQGGYDYVGVHDVGGGVYVMTATATLNNNQIYNNNAPYGGGGVFLGYTTAQLNNNIISKNGVNTGGAGLFAYRGSPTLVGNLITANTSQNLGGGLYLFSTSAEVTGNTISENYANTQGGGVVIASCNPTFNGNLVIGNTTLGKGAGIFIWYSNSLFSNNVIADNHADGYGSGLWIGGSGPLLLHTTIARNSGATGYGVYATDNGGTTYSAVTLTNTVWVSQTVGVYVNLNSSVTVDGVLWYANGADTSGAGTVTVTHAYHGNPLFAPDGYHLTSASEAIDRAVRSGVLTDIDWQPRPPGAADLGADEYWPPGTPIYLYLPLITRFH